MTHYKDSCNASHMIIGNACGLVCVNCGACKCQSDPRPIEKLDTLEQLEQRRMMAWHESNEAQKRLYHGQTGYSYPAHQLKAIDKRIKEIKQSA